TDCILSCESALNAAGAGRFGPDDRKRMARDARLGLITALASRGDNRSFELARGHVQALLAEDPRNPQFQRQMAELAFKLGPTAAKVQRAYADYLLTQGNKPAAAEYLNAAKKIEPDSRETKFLEGLMARYNKNWQLAGAIFNDLNHQYPSFVQATANLALVLA